MVKKQIENFDLEQICNSGQCFRMKKLAENKYRIIVGARYLDVYQKDGEIYFHQRWIMMIGKKEGNYYQ